MNCASVSLFDQGLKDRIDSIAKGINWRFDLIVLSLFIVEDCYHEFDP